jgi:hypothetical protein
MKAFYMSLRYFTTADGIAVLKPQKSSVPKLMLARKYCVLNVTARFCSDSL